METYATQVEIFIEPEDKVNITVDGEKWVPGTRPGAGSEVVFTAGNTTILGLIRDFNVVKEFFGNDLQGYTFVIDPIERDCGFSRELLSELRRNANL